MLQALNILENFDLKAMGYNCTRYIHTLYQAMNLAFADRDFYYGDPAFPPDEPIRGLLSKDVREERAPRSIGSATIRGAGRAIRIRSRAGRIRSLDCSSSGSRASYGRAPRTTAPTDTRMTHDEAFTRGTTSIEAADTNGWVVSITPSGGWVPAVHRGQHRRRPVAADAELRARRRGNPVQRARARQAAARRR